MTDESKPAEGAIPPRLSFKQTAASDASAAAPTGAEGKKETRRVEIPLTAPAPDTAGVNKKKTSRIPLEQVTAETNAAQGTPVAGKGLASKTIRLMPPTPAPPSLSIPTSIPPSRPMTGAQAPDDAKRQTSRIPLESALAAKPGEPAASEAAPAPKTIRIKRPEAALSGKVSPATPEAGVEMPLPATLSAAKSTTSRIELTEDAQPEGQPTQRKTIKIRRAEGGAPTLKAAPRSFTVSRVEAQIAQHQAEEAASQMVPVAYPIVAAVALLILCVMLYLLVAQVFPGANLSFPGKVTL